MEESRTQTREKAMFAIYDTLMYENGVMEYEPRDVLERVFSCAYDDIDIMAREIYIKAILNEDEIISLIEPKLKNWEFKRLNLISQAILLAAISEANYAKISDKKIVINAAVKMAKKYLDSSDFKYINAVLDKVIPNNEQQ